MRTVAGGPCKQDGRRDGRPAGRHADRPRSEGACVGGRMGGRMGGMAGRVILRCRLHTQALSCATAPLRAATPLRASSQKRVSRMHSPCQSDHAVDTLWVQAIPCEQIQFGLATNSRTTMCFGCSRLCNPELVDPRRATRHKEFQRRCGIYLGPWRRRPHWRACCVIFPNG